MPQIAFKNLYFFENSEIVMNYLFVTCGTDMKKDL